MRRERDSNADRIRTAEGLRAWVETYYGVVVVANHEPFRHDRTVAGSVVVTRSAGGLVTALEPLMHACSGVWVAHGAGTADKATVDRGGRTGCATRQSHVRLRRVWLEDHQERGYYYGFANEGLYGRCVIVRTSILCSGRATFIHMSPSTRDSPTPGARK
jgi:trehalose 6-phosphate synthase